tara:strand:+ start:61 stop:240 length:180 start_codon:yes stop_codon:yes gene_type:complete
MNNLEINNRKLAWSLIDAIQIAIGYGLKSEFQSFYLNHRKKGNSVEDSISYALLEWDLV